MHRTPSFTLPAPIHASATRRSSRSAGPGLALALCALAASCGAGAPAASDPDPQFEEGSYSLADFTFEPEQAPGFHPLGTRGALLTPRVECFTTMPTRKLETSSSWLQEGPDEDHAEVPGTQGLFGELGSLRGTAAGNLDDDAAEELVGVELLNGGALMRVHRADRLLDGTFEVTTLLDLPAEGWAMADARIELEDVDGDFRDELVIVARDHPFEETTLHAWVRVYDDPEAGGGLLLHEPRDAAHTNIWGLVADLAGDGEPEVVVALEGDTSHIARLSVRTFGREPESGQFVQTQDWTYLIAHQTESYSKPAVGDFDFDGRDEIAAIGYDQSPATELDVWLWGHDNDAEWTEIADLRLNPPASEHPVSGKTWDVTAYARQNQADALALLIPAAGFMRLELLAYEPGPDSWSSSSHLLGVAQMFNLIVAIEPGDTDSDGSQELHCAYVHLSDETHVFRQTHVDPDAGPDIDPLPAKLLPGDAYYPLIPSLTCADVDADGLTVEFTGKRTLGLASPIPLVLMHAPPTKAGISQNYDSSETNYSVASSAGQTTGVSTQATVSLSLGYEAEDFSGSFGSSAKATIGASLAKSQVSSTQTTFVQGFAGSYDEDVILFQGTLYESYEYAVLSAPEPGLVGSFVTVDVPVQTKTYSWTVDYFNSIVAPEDRIPDDLVPHAVGDPASYPRRSALLDELDGVVHWADPDLIPVGQGGGVRSSSVELSEEQAEETQTTLFAEFESGFKAGYGTVETSTGIEHGHSYSVAYGTATTYGGVVGNVAGAADYENWRYDWGVAVENRGMLADGGNEPMGYQAGTTPFQIIRYWVDPNGAAYPD